MLISTSSAKNYPSPQSVRFSNVNSLSPPYPYRIPIAWFQSIWRCPVEAVRTTVRSYVFRKPATSNVTYGNWKLSTQSQSTRNPFERTHTKRNENSCAVFISSCWSVCAGVAFGQNAFCRRQPKNGFSSLGRKRQSWWPNSWSGCVNCGCPSRRRMCAISAVAKFLAIWRKRISVWVRQPWLVLVT